MGRQGWKEVAAARPFTLKVEGGTSRFFSPPHESLFPKADKAGFDDLGAHFL